MKKLTIFLLGLFAFGSTLAQTQVPNTFQAGQPARASEVNANFSAVVVAVNQNSSAIASNTDRVSASETQIASNATAIGENSQAISNVTQIANANSQSIQSIGESVSALMPEPGYQFVGFSTAQLDGAAGYFPMNAACRSDFGPSARMATSYEVINSTISPSLQASFARVRPFPVGVMPSSTATFPFFVDLSGAYASSDNLSCESFTRTSGSGLGVTPTGSVIMVGCLASYPIACSAQF